MTDPVGDDEREVKLRSIALAEGVLRGDVEALAALGATREEVDSLIADLAPHVAARGRQVFLDSLAQIRAELLGSGQ